jgi:Trypsin-like peptidase domain
MDALAQSRDTQFGQHGPAVSVGENFSAAVCPVVYPLDDSPGTRGYHYIFYGNAFFINRDGYLLTAAHVLSEFHNGGQPSILVRLASAPPRLLKTEIVAADLEHDVAILRATPNPFSGPYTVATLPLSEDRPVVGAAVEATALRPARLKDPHTFELPIADIYPAAVLDYHSMVLNPNPQAPIASVTTPSKELAKTRSSAPPPSTDEPVSTRSSALRFLGQSEVQTDLFLFSHDVQHGQSGAPVASATTHQVVGIIEGRWLHPAASVQAKPAKNSVPRPPSLTQGAAIPIPYAIALLQKNHIHWNAGTVSTPSTHW